MGLTIFTWTYSRIVRQSPKVSIGHYSPPVREVEIDCVNTLPLTSGVRHSALDRPSLNAIRMTVAPIPIVPLHSVMLPMVPAITPVLFRQVTPVGVVFRVVPVMVI
jgi:hypothetical protein